MRAIEHAPVWEWRAWWWIPDERDVPQIPQEIDERRTEHVCLDSDRVGALQMKVRLQAEQIEHLRDQVRRLGAAPVA